MNKTFTIHFIGGPHDGDVRKVAYLRYIYYRTNIVGDATLYASDSEGTKLIYVRQGETNKYILQPYESRNP